LSEADTFFENVEAACEEIQQNTKRDSFGGGEGGGRRRAWTELRIRRAELVKDNVTLPIQRLREAVSELIKLSEDKDIGQELVECNRRLAELRDEVKAFLEQSAPEHVYWVERSGKAHKNLALNAAPIDVADFLRRRLFESDTSIIMTSATLAVSAKVEGRESKVENRKKPSSLVPRPSTSPLNYFAKRVGAEAATLLQVGTPFDYERQMKLFVASKMPDPREAGYADALERWIGHFVKQTHGKAFVLFTNYKLMQGIAERMEPFFNKLASRIWCRAGARPARRCSNNSRTTWIRCCSARIASGRAWTCQARR